MTARERLANAQACIAEGRYAEALLDMVWFHEHALADTPSMRGVRLSYALHYWVRLGELYPPALIALKDTRDQKAAALLRGEVNRSAFTDVAAIDEYLGAIPNTCSLFRELLIKQPELAHACARDAMRAIVAAEDYQLAARFIPDAESFIINRSAQLNRDVRMLKHRPYSLAPARWADICIYVDAVEELLKIKAGTGEHAEAARLKSLAIARIESPSLRREVQAGFVKRPRAPVPRR